MYAHAYTIRTRHLPAAAKCAVNSSMPSALACICMGLLILQCRLFSVGGEWLVCKHSSRLGKQVKHPV